ncbi:TetR/AcrR family transcriptional regulator [Planomicrobium okeanokoites]|uniref:TetR/AcrR family transcriptional regulator n=1 Tax=Planomicrobium okeanokoites TaxID=244 RepID=UPI00249388E2|nr:TetR/AcrR family transcriptional regulator [Planomicrobium okeanokoites]
MKKQEILTAAILQYSKYGYQGATMKRIADEVGIKPASIYFFFENKEALFIAAFQEILENHHNAMEKVLENHIHEPVNRIFSAMLRGIVGHHTFHQAETSAYISLVTAPIPSIKTHIQKYMLDFDNWMLQSLESALLKTYPSIQTIEMDSIIKQFVLLANGVFWGINIYDSDYLEEQVQAADEIIQSMFLQLNRNYGHPQLK